MPRTEIEKTLCRIPEEIFSLGRLEVAEEVFQPDFVENQPLPPDFPKGIAGLKQLVTLMRTAFPDLRYRVEDIFSAASKVCIRVTVEGTHKGEFMGIPPSGNRCKWTETHIALVRDGKLAEHWSNLDQLGMMQQMGAIPAPA